MFYDDQKKDFKGGEDEKPPGSLDLFDQPAMEQFFTKGIRGGQSFIATRHAKGNDDPKTPGEHLLYVDGIYLIFYLISYNISMNIFLLQLTTFTVAWKRLNYLWEIFSGSLLVNSSHGQLKMS